MNVLNDLLMNIEQDAPVRDILVGAHWTVVCSKYCGLASTWLAGSVHNHRPARDVGLLHLKSARELAELVLSENLLEASIGLAAINSLIAVDVSQAVEINAVDVIIQHGQGKKVVLVGHFPFIPKLRQAAGNLWVLEQHPEEGEFPAEAAADLIPQADVVAITSSTLINHTLEGLLAYCRPQALVMLLGPSTPLSPVLFNHSVDMLAGSKVVDEAAVLRTVSQGANFQQVQGVRLITLKSDNGN